MTSLLQESKKTLALIDAWISYFHVAGNVGVEIMCSKVFEDKLLLKHISKYTKNTPNVILNFKTETDIKQTAAQMWRLIQNCYFDGPCEFILLWEICSTVFSLVVARGLAVFLKQHHRPSQAVQRTAPPNTTSWHIIQLRWSHWDLCQN